MDNIKDNKYFLKKIVSDLNFIIAHTNKLTKSELASNELLLDSMMFRLIQVSENSDRLNEDFKINHPEIQWRAIKGLRNRIVHDYGEIDLEIVHDTLVNDIPILHVQIKKLL